MFPHPELNTLYLHQKADRSKDLPSPLMGFLTAFAVHIKNMGQNDDLLLSFCCICDNRVPNDLELNLHDCHIFMTVFPLSLFVVVV